MYIDAAGYDGQVFRSVFALEKTERLPWICILVGVAIFPVGILSVEVPLLAVAAFLAWFSFESWQAAGSGPTNAGAPFNVYSRLQPSRRMFAPLIGGLASVGICGFLPHGFWLAVGIASVLAILMTIDTVRSACERSALPEPPFNTFTALTRRDIRPTGWILSSGAHLAVWLLPVLAAFLAAHSVVPQLRTPPEKLTVLFRPKPADVKKKKPKPVLPAAASVRLPEDDHPPAPYVGKPDLHRMTLEFATDQEQALSNVLEVYGAQVAFINHRDSDSYLNGTIPFLSADYLYTAVQWLPLASGGDISDQFLLRLQEPDRCKAIADIMKTLPKGGSDFQVWLVFPREGKAFELELERAITEEARKESNTLHGEISGAKIAFTRAEPWITVQHLESTVILNSN